MPSEWLHRLKADRQSRRNLSQFQFKVVKKNSYSLFVRNKAHCDVPKNKKRRYKYGAGAHKEEQHHSYERAPCYGASTPRSKFASKFEFSKKFPDE